METVKLTPELRRRLPFLGHLPIHCDVSFVEIDMTGLVSEATAARFQEGARIQLFWSKLSAVQRDEQRGVIFFVFYSVPYVPTVERARKLFVISVQFFISEVIVYS